MKQLFPFRIPARILAAGCSAVLAGAAVGTGDGSLVLVAGLRSPITRLTPVEARRIYLGEPLLIDGKGLKAIRNTSDLRVEEMFLQRLMFMSRQDYERQIKARAERSGRPAPPAYGDVQALLRALDQNPMAVTYMPRGWANTQAGLRIVAEP